jgi:hypothetical protein
VSIQKPNMSAEILAIQNDPAYIRLKNKVRSKQEQDKFNLYLRRLEKLETSNISRRAPIAQKPGGLSATKPAWKNQPKTVAHRNQTDGHIQKNWVKDAVPLAVAHPERAAVVVEPVTPSDVATVAAVEPLVPGGGLVVPDNKKVRRTPTELKRFEEKSAETKVRTVPIVSTQPRARITARQEPVRKVAPIVDDSGDSDDSSNEEIIDDLED